MIQGVLVDGVGKVCLLRTGGNGSVVVQFLAVLKRIVVNCLPTKGMSVPVREVVVPRPGSSHSNGPQRAKNRRVTVANIPMHFCSRTHTVHDAPLFVGRART